MKVSKPTYHGKSLSSWYVSFKDHHDIRRRVRAFTDKAASNEFGRKVDNLVGVRATRQGPDPDMMRWLEGLSNYHREKFAKWGLLDERASSLSKPLTEHVTDYHEALLTKGRTDLHARHQTARVLALVNGCGFTYWRDITAGRVERWLSVRRQAGKIKQRTSNHYAAAAKGFCSWMVKDGRAVSSPLSLLDRVTVADEERFGVFTVEQVRRLVAHCNQATDNWDVKQRKPGRASPTRFLTGPQRALVYRFAVETALRATAIRTLQVGQIRFDHDKNGQIVGGVVRTTVRQQKNRRAHDVPLRRSFAVELAEQFTGTAPAVRPFTDLTVYAAEMLRNDLFNAGLPLIDEDGLPLKFHSFRGTCATWLGEAGLSATEISAITGHQTRSMADHYTHATRAAGRKAIERLPDLTPARMTGTDDGACHQHEIPGAALGRSVPLDAPSRYQEPRTDGRGADRNRPRTHSRQAD